MKFPRLLLTLRVDLSFNSPARKILSLSPKTDKTKTIVKVSLRRTTTANNGFLFLNNLQKIFSQRLQFPHSTASRMTHENQARSIAQVSSTLHETFGSRTHFEARRKLFNDFYSPFPASPLLTSFLSLKSFSSSTHAIGSANRKKINRIFPPTSQNRSRLMNTTLDNSLASN